MTASLLITFREGLEAFLVVGIILSCLGRLNLEKYNKWIYTGVVLALITAFFIGILFQFYYTGFESKLGELRLKVSIMALAVIMLTYMLVWMAKYSHRMRYDIEKSIASAITKGSIFSFVLMAYIAVLREGFETVLFLGALYGDNLDSSVFYGGVSGLGIALLITVMVFKGIKKIPITLFFTVASLLIMLIAAGLLINMIGIMQDINWIPVLEPNLIDLSWLMVDSSNIGIFFKAILGYTQRPTLVQMVSYLAYFVFIVYFLFYAPKRSSVQKE